MRLRGIVLAGAYPYGRSTLDRLRPRPLLPVAQVPLLVHALRWLRDLGHVTVCVNHAVGKSRALLEEHLDPSVNLDFVEDDLPRGPAGCVRDASLKGDARFVVVEGTSIPCLDLDQLVDSHVESGAAVTVVGLKPPATDGARAALTPVGVYVFERDALDFISPGGFQDIKEALIPRLRRAGLPVGVHLAEGPSPRVIDADTYLAVNAWMVSRANGLSGYVRRGEALVHATARVAARARLAGPMAIGPNTEVEAGATIVGPSSIGARCRIQGHAVVSRSVLWDRCNVGAGALVDRCLLSDDAVVAARAELRGVLRSGRDIHGPSRAEALALSARPAARA